MRYVAAALQKPKPKKSAQRVASVARGGLVREEDRLTVGVCAPIVGLVESFSLIWMLCKTREPRTKRLWRRARTHTAPRGAYRASIEPFCEILCLGRMRDSR